MKRKPLYPQQALADRLRAALDDADISQAQLARACGVTEPSVHGWVTTGRIAKEHLPTIAALTGKTLDYFLVGLKNWRRVAAIALPFERRLAEMSAELIRQARLVDWRCANDPFIKPRDPRSSLT